MFGKNLTPQFFTKPFFRNSENEQKGSWQVQGWMWRGTHIRILWTSSKIVCFQKRWRRGETKQGGKETHRFKINPSWGLQAVLVHWKRTTSKDECHSFTRTWTVHWECQQDRSLCQWRQENNSTWQNTNSSSWSSGIRRLGDQGRPGKGQGVPRGKLGPNGKILSLCLFLETNSCGRCRGSTLDTLDW